MQPDASAPRPRPSSTGDLFWSFTWLALQGFGGVLAVVQREIVEKKRWLTADEFLEDWAVAQVLPGPNVINLALMIGDRYFGLRGAAAALAGMLCLPLVVILVLAVLYAHFAADAQVAGALRGMAAVAAGLVAATGIKLVPALRRHPLGFPTGLALVALVFGAVALLRLPLAWVLLGVGGVGLLVDLEAARRMTITLHWPDWLALFGQYMLLSLMSISGAITTVPDMHRYLVDQKGWLTDPQLASSVAIAQAAPGPNVLFVALMGWNVGLNAGGGIGAGPRAWALGLLGMAVTMVGIMLPSTTLTFLATRWGHRNRERRAVRAFKQGMAPVVVGLLLATGWVLAAGNGALSRWPVWLLAALAAFVVWRTRIHLLWLLGTGALLGALGLV